MKHFSLLATLGIFLIVGTLFAATLNTYPIGTIVLNGGQDSGTTDAQSFDGDDSIIGKIENNLDLPNYKITDLDLELESTGTLGSSALDGTVAQNGAAATNFTIAGKSVPVVNGRAYVDGLNISEDADANFTITGVTGGAGDDLLVKFNPSITAVTGAFFEANVFEKFDVSQASDSERNDLAAVRHTKLLASVSNQDGSKRINEFSGHISFPGSSRADVVAVELRDAATDAFISSTLTVTGDTFVIDGFTPRPAGSGTILLIDLDSALNLNPARVRITGTFVQ